MIRYSAYRIGLSLVFLSFNLATAQKTVAPIDYPELEKTNPAIKTDSSKFKT